MEWAKASKRQGRKVFSADHADHDGGENAAMSKQALHPAQFSCQADQVCRQGTEQFARLDILRTELDAEQVTVEGNAIAFAPGIGGSGNFRKIERGKQDANPARREAPVVVGKTMQFPDERRSDYQDSSGPS